MKFVLIGLPGVGKSTTLQKHVELLNKENGTKATLIITDDLINQRIKDPNDRLVQQYAKEYGLSISPKVFTADNPSQAFIEEHTLEALCHLEARLLIDIINSSQEKDWLDLGGRAPLLPGVIEALKIKGILPILLDAEHKTIVERLGKDGEWQKRPTYRLAVKQGKGWIANAELHRQERLNKYRESAAITICVEKTLSRSENTESTALYKSSEEILVEISDKIKEFLCPSYSYNKMIFFENGSLEESTDNQQPQQLRLTAKL